MDKQLNKPCLLVFAGPNGSGKSTIKSLFEIKGQYTNADDIVAAKIRFPSISYSRVGI